MGRRTIEPEASNTMGQRIFTIYEGMTERQYMELFVKYNSTMDRFEFIEYDKRGFDLDQTDREKLVQMIEGLVVYYREGRFTPFHLATELLMDMSDES